MGVALAVVFFSRFGKTATPDGNEDNALMSGPSAGHVLIIT